MTDSRDNLVGRRIGQIRITEVLGKGGMGTVYSGFHERLERKVAIKLIRTDRRMSEEARTRFLREARILSRLNHPSVCRVHDLLETPEGDILVLELVEGISLRQRIREGLDQTEALSIARQLLDVLVAVHRQGIVHRDLKPENIMVQPGGAIKVLDFGVARAMEVQAASVPRSTLLTNLENKDPGAGAVPLLSPDPHVLTNPGVLVGTVRYMSPEQARGETATSASDVYAAALILLEMLTSEPPFPKDLPLQALLTKVAWGDLQHVRDLHSPLRTFIERLTSLAPADRPSARDAVDQLDFILNAPRRRKRRRLVTATLSLLALLTVGMMIQWARASREAKRAQRSLAETREVSSFLEQLFQLSNPFFTDTRRGPAQQTVSVEDLLDRGTRMIEDRFSGQPLMRARFMMLLGRIQRNLGHYGKAATLFQEALAIRRTALPPTHLGIAEALRELGEDERLQTHFHAAGQHLEEVRSIEKARGGAGSPGTPDTLESLALLAEGEGHVKEALPMLQDVYRLRLAHPGQNRRDLALTLQRLGVVETSLARYDEARRHLREALEIVHHLAGRNHPAVAALLIGLGNLEMEAGHLKAAEKSYRDGLGIARQHLERTHPLRVSLVTSLANTLDNEGRYEEARPLYEEALALAEKTAGPAHIKTGQVLLNLAMLEHHEGHLSVAEHYFGRAVTIFEKAAGPTHPFTAIAYLAHGALEEDRHRYGRAKELYGKSLAIFRSKLGPEHPYTAMALNNIGEINRLQGKLQTAETYYRRALAIDEKTLGPQDPAVAEIVRGLAITRAHLGDKTEARQLFARAEKILKLAGQPVDQLRTDRQKALRTPSSSTR